MKNTKMSRKARLALCLKLVLLFAVFIFSFQQCSEVRLSQQEDLQSFESRGFPFRLDPPTDFPSHHRYVIMVDMSNSMVSGPCPFDVGNSPRWNTGSPHYQWDPNKPDPRANRTDGRTIARDCMVDPSLPVQKGAELAPTTDFEASPPIQYSTYRGNDFEGHRLEALRTWINQLTTRLPDEVKDRTQVMIVPVSGGKAQVEIDERFPLDMKFYGLNGPELESALVELETIHSADALEVQSPSILRWFQTIMGTTAPGDVMDDLYRAVRNDMRDLNDLGQLTYSSYSVYYFGDGLVKPIKQNITDVLAVHPKCSACSGDFESCAGVCTELRSDMEKNWGIYTNNSEDSLDFNISLIQALPKYYGGGKVKFGFIETHPERIDAIHPEDTMFDKLAERALSRKSRIHRYFINSSRPPFDLAAQSQELTTFKLTHLYILNPNVRVNLENELAVDSDGDGLYDVDEATYGTDPTNPRSNGFCLDSLATNPLFATQCEMFAQGEACNPKLDLDSDSLNECEEKVLNTDDFDFDTDGDSLPDSLEWIYGYNPNSNDLEVDTNGDGYPNLINFSAGLAPTHHLKEINQTWLTRYSVDLLGQDEIDDPTVGRVLVDRHEVMLNQMAVAQTMAFDPNGQFDLFSRAPSSILSTMPFADALIPSELQLLGFNRSTDVNTILAIARIVNPDSPELVYWRIMRAEVPSQSRAGSRLIDLSTFKQIRAIDQNQAGGI